MTIITTVFVLSLFLLVFLYGFKFLETKQEVKFFPEFRYRADARVVSWKNTALAWISWGRGYISKDAFAHYLHEIVTHGIGVNRKLETKLWGVKRVVSGKYTHKKESSTQASPFLKSVKEHKTELQRFKKEGGVIPGKIQNF